MRVNVRRAAAGHRGVTGFVVGVVATMTIAGGGVALAAIPSSSSAKFTGCVAKTGGALRVIDAQAGKKCKSTEKTISWSKGWTHRGAWAAGTAYKPGDVVTANGSSYVAKVKSTAAAPASNAAAWGLLAAAGTNGTNGTNGAKGDKGDKGDPGPVTIKYVSGSTTTIETNTATYVDVECPDQSLHPTGGGISISGLSPTVGIREQGPLDGADADFIPDDGWWLYIWNDSATTYSAIPYVVCSSATSVS